MVVDTGVGVEYNETGPCESDGCDLECRFVTA